MKNSTHKKVGILFLAALTAALLPSVSRAQGVSRTDVSAGYSLLFIIKGFTLTMNGGSVAGAVNVNDWFGVTGDFGVYDGSAGIPGLIGETYIFGPRFSYPKWHRLVPFAQVSIGGGHANSTNGAFLAREMHLPQVLAWAVTLSLIALASSHYERNWNFSTFARTTTYLQTPTREPSASRPALSIALDGNSLSKR